MYRVHDWAEVHRLFHREGWHKTDIADRLGMSRNTVTRLLELAEPARYERKFSGSVYEFLYEGTGFLYGVRAHRLVHKHIQGAA